MAEIKEKLFDQFPPITTEQWREKVDADLKGAPFEKKLVWRTNEGFNVNPMYRLEDIEGLKTIDTLPGEYPYVRGTKNNNDWLARQEIIVDNIADANAKALEVLTKGITSVYFKLSKEQIDTVQIQALLNGIDLATVEVNFGCCPACAKKLCEILVAIIKQAGVVDSFRGSIDYNPLRKALRHGGEILSTAVADAKEMINLAQEINGLRVISVDSAMLSNAGCYIYQELGYALAWGAEWLNQLTDAGVDATEAGCAIKFNMGISSNYFIELAKFRAARMLWAQIVKQYDPKCDCACKMMVHAETSRYNQTIYDAHVNLLRSQTEAMSAALAGVDSITVVPFDAPYKTPDAFSERIARNQQFLLKEESHLDKVVDPAGGSYYVETLTVSIAQQAWELFLNVQNEGGFFKAVTEGTVQKAVNESAAKRQSDVARRKEVLLGTNQYPNFNELAAEKIEKTGCNCGCNHSDGDSAKALNNARQASDFEKLRLATEHAANRPKVFMLTIGNLAMRLARAQFSSNFFGCAGYEIIDNIGFETIADGVNAAFEKQADIIVLCSSDDEYAQYAPEAFELINGKAKFVVAGAPACTEELQAKGITEFIHVRSNVLDTLRKFNAELLK